MGIFLSACKHVTQFLHCPIVYLMLCNGSVRCFGPSQAHTTSLAHVGLDDLVVGLDVLKGLFQPKPFHVNSQHFWILFIFFCIWISYFILQVLITFYHISTWYISSACLFIEKLVMNIIVSKNTAWHGRSIVSVYHTAYFLTSTRALQMPDLQITSEVSLFANKNIPLTFALGLFVI